MSMRTSASRYSPTRLEPCGGRARGVGERAAGPGGASPGRAISLSSASAAMIGLCSTSSGSRWGVRPQWYTSFPSSSNSVKMCCCCEGTNGAWNARDIASRSAATRVVSAHMEASQTKSCAAQGNSHGSWAVNGTSARKDTTASGTRRRHTSLTRHGMTAGRGRMYGADWSVCHATTRQVRPVSCMHATSAHLRSLPSGSAGAGPHLPAPHHSGYEHRCACHTSGETVRLIRSTEAEVRHTPEAGGQQAGEGRHPQAVWLLSASCQ